MSRVLSLLVLVTLLQPVLAADLADRMHGIPVDENASRSEFFSDKFTPVDYSRENETYKFLEKIPDGLAVNFANGIFLIYNSTKIRILENLGDGYIVAVNGVADFLKEIPEKYKIDERLLEEKGEVTVKVLLFRAADEEIKSKLSKFGSILKVKDRVVILRTNASRIGEIARVNEVRYICERYNFTPSLVEASRLIANDVVLDAGFAVRNVTVGIVDSGIASHPHFRNIKLFYSWDWVDNDRYPVDENRNSLDYGHGTHVAGIISGSGSYRGEEIRSVTLTAPLLVSRVFGPDVDGDGYSDWYYDADASGDELWKRMLDPDMDGNFHEQNSARVICCSWGSDNGFGTYDEWAYEVDSIISGKYALRPLIVFPTGNAGSTRPVSPPATAKNAITVGAVYDTVDIGVKVLGFSQRGTLDGRIKPDVLAPGAFITSAVPLDRNPEGYETWEGTSMAAPFVAALAAQIEEKYPDATPELVKAMIIAGTYGGGTTDRPDVNHGWGRVSVYQTIFKTKDEVVDAYDFGVLGNGKTVYPSEVRYEVEVPEGAAAMVVTLVYSDDPGPIGLGTLQNDLDLYIVTPNGSTTIGGWDTYDDDSTNNVEKYILKNPEPGRYEIHVKAIKFNDLGGNVPKFVNYAVVVRVIKPEGEPNVKIGLENGELKVRSVGESVYECLLEFRDREGRVLSKVSVGDVPLGCTKTINFSIDVSGLGSVHVYFKDMFGNEYSHTLSPESIRSQLDAEEQSDESQGIGKSASVVRDLPPVPEENATFTVILRIEGIDVGALKENVPGCFEFVSAFSSDPANVSMDYDPSARKFVASWIGDVRWIKYILRARSLGCEFYGVYIDLKSGFDAKKIEGDSGFDEATPDSVKRWILGRITDYIFAIQNGLAEADAIKGEILSYILKYTSLERKMS